MARIFINGRFLSQPLTGVQRFALELVKALDRQVAQGESAEITILIPKNGAKILGLQNCCQRKVGCLTGHAWDQVELPVYSQKGILVSLCGSGPVVHKNHVVTFHDAAVYANGENFTLPYIAWHKSLGLCLSRSAQALVTVSDFSRGELSRVFPSAAPKLSVIPNGSDHILGYPPDERIISRHRLKAGSYVFALGNVSPNKNVSLIVDAVRLLDDPKVRLVFAGGYARNIFGSSDATDDPRVLHVGRASDSEIRSLYENALCFAFPSFYEGFGIPPLEAMQCRCPVIVSDIPALRQTCGSAALYCDPFDPASLATQVDSIAKSRDLRESLVRAGVARARFFTWERSAAILLSLISDVCGRRGRRLFDSIGSAKVSPNLRDGFSARLPRAM